MIRGSKVNLLCHNEYCCMIIHLAAFPSHTQNAPLHKICSASHAKLDNHTALFIDLAVQRLLTL